MTNALTRRRALGVIAAAPMLGVLTHDIVRAAPRTSGGDGSSDGSGQPLRSESTPAATAGTTYQSISGVAFKPRSSATGWAADGGSSNGSTRATAGVDNFTYLLNIPNGATITEVVLRQGQCSLQRRPVPHALRAGC